MPPVRTFDWKRRARISLAFVAVCIGTGATAQYALSLALPPEPVATHAEAAPAVSTTTPERAIAALTIDDAVPETGKFIVADLVNMKLTLYQDGAAVADYPILTKGRPGTPYETPSGFYSILSKEADHVNGWEHVSMPYSMEFYGNYFIHGWPMYEDGTPVASSYSGGCIRLSTDDAAKVFAFADRGTGVFVYDTGAAAAAAPPLALSGSALPPVSAASYLIADIDTGDVYAEQNAAAKRPIASVTKLMTALVANETIMFDRPITVPRGELTDINIATDTEPETFVVGDLLYPLLMESNNNIAESLAKYYGTSAFVRWMNDQAQALDMTSTTFADASGVSADDISTPEDLYRLAVYLANKKSFIWNITRTPEKTITSADGSTYSFANFNVFANQTTFVGGKVGHTTPARDTMVSVFTTPIGGEERRVAVIVLGSDDYAADTRTLADWFAKSAAPLNPGTACVTCAAPPVYEKIQL